MSHHSHSWHRFFKRGSIINICINSFELCIHLKILSRLKENEGARQHLRQNDSENLHFRVSNWFRIYDENTNTQLWDRVTKLEKGAIYYEGTVKNLQDLTGWRGQSVLYFGDHPYSDLADVTLMHGWRTGAIINELSVRFCTSFIDLLSCIALFGSTKLKR